MRPVARGDDGLCFIGARIGILPDAQRPVEDDFRLRSVIAEEDGRGADVSMREDCGERGVFRAKFEAGTGLASRERPDVAQRGGVAVSARGHRDFERRRVLAGSPADGLGEVRIVGDAEGMLGADSELDGSNVSRARG